MTKKAEKADESTQLTQILASRCQLLTRQEQHTRTNPPPHTTPFIDSMVDACNNFVFFLSRKMVRPKVRISLRLPFELVRGSFSQEGVNYS